MKGNDFLGNSKKNSQAMNTLDNLLEQDKLILVVVAGKYGKKYDIYNYANPNTGICEISIEWLVRVAMSYIFKFNSSNFEPKYYTLTRRKKLD